MSATRALDKMMAGIKGRIGLMIGRAVLAALDDDGGRQYIQVTILSGEVRDRVERVQEYGFTSSPLPGAQAVILTVGGNRDHPVAIAVDDPRHRLHGLQPGEVAVYNHLDESIVIKLGGEIRITAHDKVVIDAPRVEVTGDLVDRTGSGNGRTVQDMRDIYDEHTHNETDSVTNPPNEQMGA